LALLNLVGITKWFENRTVLKSVSLEVDEGCISAIMGPNGAGKSTLLKITALIIEPSEGEVVLDGRSCRGPEDQRRVQRRKMALVFQKPVLFNMSVEDNVSIGLRARGVQDRVVRDRVDEIVVLLALADLRRRDPKTLSGGEAQRVALARALVMRPKLLLLDEPTASADPNNASIIEKAVMTAASERGCGVLLATHNPQQARRLAKETAFLFDGQILETGPTDSLLSRPKDDRTRGYVSGMMPR